jgi:hypothetical protein
MNTPTTHPVLPVATITVDTNPGAAYPYILTLHTPSGPRTSQFRRLAQAQWVVSEWGRRLALTVHTVPGE